MLHCDIRLGASKLMHCGDVSRRTPSTRLQINSVSDSHPHSTDERMTRFLGPLLVENTKGNYG